MTLLAWMMTVGIFGWALFITWHDFFRKEER